MNFSRKLIAIIMCLVPLFVLLILFNYSFLGLPNQSTNQRAKTFPVLITVFYEALCPDSKYFLSKQMLPAFKLAASIMDVKLVPYVR
ncbi:gamma-interferon-inducible lysosomal thiol reductase isoform X1 [Drosophila ananassae]|uniref:gamma-interferon-inducible lysosomal thiol reductase isoform X1 n=1 Tax=Drosophila ananassae TaxID=7217 RepID=UPI001CFF6883|nr:gamma-interferon-inducible lysosomal thiol reductase isoform X1 [Drosophila ananassae]